MFTTRVTLRFFRRLPHQHLVLKSHTTRLKRNFILTEKSTLKPNSLYSASKALADMLARTYFVDVSITRSSNDYGTRQHPEKLIPRMVIHGRIEEALPICDDGENVRDWLYIENNWHTIELVMRRGRAGEVYNIGGYNERTNIEIVRELA